MTALDPAEDFEDEGESLHQRRMREARDYLRRIDRAERNRRGALVSFWAFPFAFVGLLAVASGGLLAPAVAAIWITSLPVLFVAAVVSGIHLIHGDDHSGWPYGRHHFRR